MISIDEFNGIYRQHVDAVFRVTLRSVSRREIAEEITSEVFLTFYQNAASLSSEQLPAWLFTGQTPCRRLLAPLVSRGALVPRRHHRTRNLHSRILPRRPPRQVRQP